MKKRILSAFLAASMTCSMLPLSMTASAEEADKVATAPRTQSDIIIDCVKDTAYGEGQAINKLFASDAGKSDATGTFYTAWNQNGSEPRLFFYFDINDSKIIADSPNDLGKNDRLSIYFDFANTQAETGYKQTADAMGAGIKFSLVKDGDSYKAVINNPDDDQTTANQQNFQNTARSAAKLKADGSGYIMEISVVPTQLYSDFKLAPNTEIGFDMFINDAQESGAGRAAAIGWNDDQNRSWEYPDALGEIAIADSPEGDLAPDARGVYLTADGYRYTDGAPNGGKGIMYPAVDHDIWGVYTDEFSSKPLKAGVYKVIYYITVGENSNRDFRFTPININGHKGFFDIMRDLSDEEWENCKGNKIAVSCVVKTAEDYGRIEVNGWHNKGFDAVMDKVVIAAPDYNVIAMDPEYYLAAEGTTGELGPMLAVEDDEWIESAELSNNADLSWVMVDGALTDRDGDKFSITVKKADSYNVEAKTADENATYIVADDYSKVTVASEWALANPEYGAIKDYELNINALTDNTNLKEVTVNGVKAAVAGDKVTVTVNKADKYDVKATAEDGTAVYDAAKKTITVKSMWGTEKVYTLAITEKAVDNNNVNKPADNKKPAASKKASVKKITIKQGKKAVKKIKIKLKKKTIRLKAVVTGKNLTKAYKKISWTTSKKKIATVSSKGVVKLKKKGTVKITAKNKKSGKKATVKIIIKK